ncbi:hypothetical protein C485_14190 [Natrinema altunense JCM 12890]|uniref:Uncharacterized protein n=1 Tax=Natrinema altunense (strain JCM 12890 / CGMCC 1.3731 / AJ2) TaxID=1227494 RepID=L9ZDS7_NATA2|nr:hypothetical protein C485_14190 [Natrinema altunense JCM 12890]
MPSVALLRLGVASDREPQASEYPARGGGRRVGPGGDTGAFDDAPVETARSTDTRTVTAQRRVFLSGGNILLNLNLLVPDGVEPDGTRDREEPVKIHLCATCEVT